MTVNKLEVEIIGIHNKNLITTKISNDIDLLQASSFYCVVLHVSLKNLNAVFIAFSSSAWVQSSPDGGPAEHPFTWAVLAQLRECGRVTPNFFLTSASLSG